MKLFLENFISELKDLSENGFECVPYNTEIPIKFKVHAILCSVDTIARPMIQNMKQFNGAFGCPYCLQEGKRQSLIKKMETKVKKRKEEKIRKKKMKMIK